MTTPSPAAADAPAPRSRLTECLTWALSAAYALEHLERLAGAVSLVRHVVGWALGWLWHWGAGR